MLSNKWTFSLTSLVVLIAFGLMCAVPFASANDGDEAHVDSAGKKTKGTIGPHVDFGVTLSAAESMMDVSFRGDANANNIQIMRSTDGSGARVTTEETLQILATFGVVVHLADPDVDAGDANDPDELKERAGPFSTADIIIDAYDEEGRALGILDLGTEVVDVVTISHRDPNNPGKAFLIQIDEARLEDAYTIARGGGASLEIGTLIISIPPQSVQDATLSEVIRQRKGEHEPHWNVVSNIFQIDFVEVDDGDAKTVARVDTAGVGTPGVVSIDRILDRSTFSPIETGPFNVRVILTEEPRMGDASGLTTDMIQVDGGGSATAVTAGLTYKAGANTDNVGSELMLARVGDYYALDNTAVTGLTGLPNATGRDNKYHTYSVTITPDGGVDGDLTISIKQFMDHVKPVSNQYLPLSAEQRVATTLGDAATARDARLANETLTVTVNTTADAGLAAATAAYKTRQEDVLDKVANEIPLANKAYIPAGGYLVLAADLGKAGIVASSAKLAEKVSAASKLYNTMGLGLPFPADDLDNFFRNGGTLNLGYADITAATGSGHDDSKAVAAADHADNTGYAGATTNAYAAGALIINEIMWGLDSAVKDSQYIELHNPGTAAITIDSKEWVITVGSLPTGYAAIDTVSNNPASGYWAVPGNGGVTAASPEYPTVIDLVSMSRVTDGTDGTAAASWAASMRPSANISGRRVGTPGAANAYVMPAAEPEPETEPEAPAAAVAKSGDLMISEIMVASNDGRLPQWIEIANVSAATVSLSGWSLEVDNDSADADVVGAGDTIVIDLGDVEIGEDQVALVVTKEGRDTSGIGDGEGDLRADRIINVQSDVSPDNARYSLISEMGFMISLIPPQTGAVRKPGDVVGNLEGGWELPASEGDRSSLIRREMGEAGEIMGTDAAGWVLASDTMLDGAYLTTYYGSADDMGTPGYNAGGNLPVELSKFGAKRDPLTGAVVITWSTQSELNNAGFFIKRSQQTHGKFVIVNPTMIAGAGTTAEKQSYTYTDATADPNIVYYYQIEDVSLDGNRQTLTRAHRLKGHVGAAGKATTTWGDLKSSRD